MPALLIWGGRLAAGWLATEALKSVADTAKSGADGLQTVQKAIPWVIGGAVLFVVLQKGAR